MPEDIIKKLINQHQELKGILGGARVKLDQANPDCEDINLRLKKFKKALGVHLELENATFYPQLMERINERGLDLSGTKAFIEEMTVLAREIMDFLNTYDSADKIKNSLKQFRPEFDFIISSLMIRVTSEEDGIFKYW